MSLFLSILTLTLTLFIPTCLSFTVIMSDSGVPSALVDAPQTGFSVNNNGATTDRDEQQAVYDIMKATGNDWATDIPDVCRGRWHGIECMPDKNNVFHVVSLSFGALSDDTAFPTCDPTRSYISPSITKLPHIRTLFFYRCFTDKPQPIPPFLGLMGPTLQTLVLRENGHVGPIPTQLGNLTGLRVLDLHKNNINGSIPVSFSRFTGLKSLDLSSNKLTGSIPSFAFPELTILDLNQNHLTGSIPTEIGNCDSLMKIDLSRNRLSGVIPDSIGGLTSLILMDLSYNSLSGPTPTSLNNLDSLQALILNGNPISSMIPSTAFDKFKSLMILILSDTDSYGPIPESIARLPNLRILHLDRNRLNGSIPTSFRNVNGLSELRLNDNQLMGPIPFDKEIVWRMRRKLKLENNLGLCYDGRNGFGSDLGSLSESGIDHCDMPRPGPAQMVQHVATTNEGEPGLANGEISYSVGLVQLLTVVVFSLFLL
ncbi:protein TOO MANY MOUTHS [Lactuca sativa]|uniref:protein TOO MANY MOUTHS n=1 Tax=Lactuca sativa TaxID=4236 RepID=UPI000CD93536|nr:protein TOO MANY MOUTHS [Lactuca sativa]